MLCRPVAKNGHMASNVRFQTETVKGKVGKRRLLTGEVRGRREVTKNRGSV